MKKRSARRSVFEKLTLTVSALLLAVSGFMYVNIDKNKVELQSPRSDLFANVESEQPAKKKKDNPFVIRHGSNAMPKGMGQGDAEEEFVPKWQKDRVRDLKDRGIDVTASSGSSAAPPSQSQGGGITPVTQPVQTQPQEQSQDQSELDEDELDLVPGSRAMP